MMRDRGHRVTLGKAGVVLGVVVLIGSTVADTIRPRRGTIVFGVEQQSGSEESPDPGIFNTVFSKVAQTVVPVVVSVTPKKIDTVRFAENPFYRSYEDRDILDFFFGSPRKAQQAGREKREQGLGSGVVVSREGYILTNFHVAAGIREFRVTLPDKRGFEAYLVGADSLADVAVIRIRGEIPSDLPVIRLGDSRSLRIGDWVGAIGNPFSLAPTVSAGIVSSPAREVMESTQYGRYIQTDAAIHLGNCGGALVNTGGELVGINTMVFSESGGFVGIGFAVPISMARRVMEDLIYEGRVIRGWIGVQVQEISPEARRALGIAKEAGGVLVSDVYEQQPAQRAGLRRGDVILNLDKIPVSTPEELRTLVSPARPGSAMVAGIVRNAKERLITIRVAEFTPEAAAARIRDEAAPASPAVRPMPPENRTGIRVLDLDEELRREFNIAPQSKGVLVRSVDPIVTDARDQLEPGDLIVTIKIQGRQAQAVESERQFRSIVNQLKPGTAVILLVGRSGATFYVSFEIS